MRLDLPVQGVVDRRVGFEFPLIVLHEVRDKDTNELLTVIEGLTQGSYGSDPGDPPAVLDLDRRGWNCPLGAPCTWAGLI